MIAPYVSWQFVKGHSVGITPVIAYQRFKAEGLQLFDNPVFSTSPGNVTNNGYDDSWGVGARIGYMGQFTEQFAVGAAWQSKISMGDFGKYAGLFAQQGAVRHPVELHRRLRVPADVAVAVRARLRAHLLRRRAVGQQPDRQHVRLRPAGVRRPGRARPVPRRRQRCGLRLAERRRLEDRCAVGDERPVDVPRGLQPHRQPDHAAERDFQHHRSRRRSRSVFGRRDLAARQGVGDHRRVHVRGEQLGDRPEPLRAVRSRAAVDDARRSR